MSWARVLADDEEQIFTWRQRTTGKDVMHPRYLSRSENGFESG